MSAIKLPVPPTRPSISYPEQPRPDSEPSSPPAASSLPSPAPSPSPTQKKRLYLTFDDGPNQGTDEVLNALVRGNVTDNKPEQWAKEQIPLSKCIPATFFICATDDEKVADYLDKYYVENKKYPELDPKRRLCMDEIRRRQYPLGNHGFVHYPYKTKEYLTEYGKWDAEQRAKFHNNWIKNGRYFKQHFEDKPGWEHETFVFPFARLPGGGVMAWDPKKGSKPLSKRVKPGRKAERVKYDEDMQDNMIAETEALGMTHYLWDIEFALNGTESIDWSCKKEHQNWQRIPGVACSYLNYQVPNDNSVVLFHDRAWSNDSDGGESSKVKPELGANNGPKVLLGREKLQMILHKLEDLGFQFEPLPTPPYRIRKRQ